MQINNAIVTETNTHIMDSSLIRSKEAMREYLQDLRDHAPEEMAVNQRDIESQIHEWRSHNLLSE